MSSMHPTKKFMMPLLRFITSDVNLDHWELIFEGRYFETTNIEFLLKTPPSSFNSHWWIFLQQQLLWGSPVL
jgi:hypothetical protein